MKIALIDSLYPDFIASLPFDESSTYDVELRKVLYCQFGTSDFYSRNLRALGHECVDVIASHKKLQEMWRRDNGKIAGGSVLAAQINRYKPDVVFMQDLSTDCDRGHRPLLLAGQLSCPWPGDHAVNCFSVLFTSFPHYVSRIEALGVKAVYLPLAFESSVLNALEPSVLNSVGKNGENYSEIITNQTERDIDISFCGGVGADSHWKQGTDTLEAVAAAFPTRFQWWGYGLDRLPASSALRGCYCGPAWGREMYQIYRRSKIVINRHGEVAEGFANNLRMYEAVGCGALLMTEQSPNLDSLFPKGTVIAYDPDDLSEFVLKIGDYLSCESERAEIAKAGQKHVLENHTYAQRMKVVSNTLQEMLCLA